MTLASSGTGSGVAALAPGAIAPAAAAATSWRRHLAILAALVVAVLTLFAPDVRRLIDVWWTSTTFGHCLFIAPVIGWLVWQRRHELARLTPHGWLPGLLIVAVGSLGWLMGAVAGVALARQLGMVMVLQGAVVTALGPAVARGLLFPLCYAVFMVPFGESLEAPMQTVTVAIVVPLLHLMGVPVTVDGVLITIPNGYFEVAEACSGTKFVIAMLAFGTLVANVCYVRWRRRLAFMAMALVVPVIANGLRAFGTIYAAHLTSVEAATGFDHIVYGWVFFALVIAAVLAIGWRWFDRDPAAPWFDPAAIERAGSWRTDVLFASALALAVPVGAAGAASAIAGRADPLPPHIDLPAVAGWHRVAMSRRAPWQPNYPASDHFLIGRYDDGHGSPVDLAIAVYGQQHEGKELVGFGIGPLRQNDRWVRVTDLPDIAGGAAMRITAAGPVERIVVRWYRVGDVTTNSDKRVKIETLKAKLFGGRQRAVAVLVSAEAIPGRDPNAAIRRFLAALGPIDVLADRSAGLQR